MLAFLDGSACKLHLEEVVLPHPKSHSKTPNLAPQKRLLFASQGSAICPDVGLSANGTRSDNVLINKTNRLQFKVQAKGIEQEVRRKL